MNVIGIVQTDLNEFKILFDKEERKQGQPEGNQGGLFEDLFGGNGNSGSQENPQEMTVRIKGVPEGQKANFLQMYQILQDAREMSDLEQNLTIVDRGNDHNSQSGSSDSGNR